MAARIVCIFSTLLSGSFKTGVWCAAQNDALQNNPIKSWGTENKHWNLFVARFFECPFCFEDNNKREDEIALCHDSYLEHYEFAFCRFHRCAPPAADTSIGLAAGALWLCRCPRVSFLDREFGWVWQWKCRNEPGSSDRHTCASHICQGPGDHVPKKQR